MPLMTPPEHMIGGMYDSRRVDDCPIEIAGRDVESLEAEGWKLAQPQPVAPEPDLELDIGDDDGC